MNTAILILNFNNPSDTIACIKSVLEFNTARIKIVVVDNASPNKDGVVEISNWMRDHFSFEYNEYSENECSDRALSKATFILGEQNNGYATGNNIGLKFIFKDTEIENVLVLNNDVLFVEDVIPKLVEQLYLLPDAAIVSPLLRKKDGVEIDYNCARKDISIFEVSLNFLTLKKSIFAFQKKSKDNRLLLKSNPQILDMNEFEIQLPSGSCMLLNARFFQDIGAFDPRTFLYYEENILHSKIEDRKKKAYLIPWLNCIHLGASTISKHKRRYEFDKKCDRSVWIYVNEYSKVSILKKVFFNFSYHTYSSIRFLINNWKKITVKEKVNDISTK